MSSIVEEMHTAMDAATAAILSGDYETAHSQALVALAKRSVLGRTKHGDQELDYSESGPVIKSLLDEIRRERDRVIVTATGVQRTKITYQRATD